MKLRTIIIVMAVIVVLAACQSAPNSSSSTPATTTPEQPKLTYENGVYRGGYIDPTKIEIEFSLTDGRFDTVKFRALGYKGESYLNSDDPAKQAIAGQYQQLADHLIGKDTTAIRDLYTPEKIAAYVDAISSATVRSSKMISVSNDGISRGVYALPKE